MLAARELDDVFEQRGTEPSPSLRWLDEDHHLEQLRGVVVFGIDLTVRLSDQRTLGVPASELPPSNPSGHGAMPRDHVGDRLRRLVREHLGLLGRHEARRLDELVVGQGVRVVDGDMVIGNDASFALAAKRTLAISSRTQTRGPRVRPPRTDRREVDYGFGNRLTVLPASSNLSLI